ncbi:2913_t:CDS:1, partial [Dentiscutata erythropus]
MPISTNIIMDINNLYKDTYSTSLSKSQDISDNNAVANIATTSSNTISGISIILDKGKSKP